MATTMVLRRAWAGPALFSYGFRPFFLFAALHAALMAALWVPWYLGLISLPSAFPPTVWHSHEMLFGYGPAVIAGFLLTAVPNWTGRLPVVGWPLATLCALWLAGRIAMAASAPLGSVPSALISLLFPFALCGVIAREIIAGRNWRNLKVLAGIGVLTAAQMAFHLEVWRDGHATYADHLAVAATLALIMIVGGRIVPSFTTNWLKRENPGALPASFDRFDRWTMILSVAALLAWVAAPALAGAGRGAAAALLVGSGLLQFVRQMRWVPWRTLKEPLVTVLHVAYGFVPLASCSPAGPCCRPIRSRRRPRRTPGRSVPSA